VLSSNPVHGEVCSIHHYVIKFVSDLRHVSIFSGNISPMSLPHTTSDDVQVGGYRIPKGAVVIPNLDSVMHDETIFPDSCKFKE
jgi:hypothetical protein